MAAPPSTSRITEEEWDRHKQAILHLYLGTGHEVRDSDGQTEGQTLHQLAASMMAIHGFTASTSQFEAKLKSWGARKYLTPDEWKSVFERLDKLPRTTKSRVVICGRVVRQDRVTRARRYYSSKSRSVGKITSPNPSEASPLAKRVRIEVQAQDGQWTQLPELSSIFAVDEQGPEQEGRMHLLNGLGPYKSQPEFSQSEHRAISRDNTGSEQLLSSTSHDTAQEGIGPAEGRQASAEPASFEVAMPPIGSFSETIEMAIHSNVEGVLFGNHNLIPEMPYYEQPGTSSLAVEINDPMALVNFSLPSPGEDGTYDKILPTFSIDPVAIGVPAQCEVIGPSGNGRRQAVSPQPTGGSFVTAATPSGGSYSPIIPLSSWVSARPSHLSGWRGSQWMAPSAKISSIIVQDIYRNAGSLSASNAMLNPFSLANRFMDEMAQSAEASGIQSALSHETLSALSRLFSPEIFVGEIFAEQPNGLPAQLTVEARLYSRLITSLINGFSGFDNILIASRVLKFDSIPASGVLRFLARHPAMQVSIIRLLASSTGPTNKSLAENIFRAALEDNNVEIVKFLLSDSKLVDANDTVCYFRGHMHTPLEIALLSRSYRVLELLVSLGVDIKKSFKYFPPFHDSIHLLIKDFNQESSFDNNLLDLLDAFIAAGAIITEPAIDYAFRRADPRVALCLIKKLAFRSPPQLIHDDILRNIIKKVEITEAIRVIKLIVEQCQKIGGGWPRDEYLRIIDIMILEDMEQGYVELALGDEGTKLFASLISALRTGDHNFASILLERGIFSHLRPYHLHKALIVAMEERNHSFTAQMLDLDPDLQSISYRRNDEQEILAIALANDFDSIAWIILAQRINPGLNNSEDIKTALYQAMKNRKRDFVRALLELRPYFGFYPEEVIWTIAMEWADDIVMNDLLQDGHYTNFASIADLKFAIDKGHRNWFWDILKISSTDCPNWLWAGVIAIDMEDLPLLDELIVYNIKVLGGWLLYYTTKRYPLMVKPLLERFQKAYPLHQEYAWPAIGLAIKLYPKSLETLELFFAFGLITRENINNAIIREDSQDFQKKLDSHYLSGERDRLIIPSSADMEPDEDTLLAQAIGRPSSGRKHPRTGLVKRLLDMGADVDTPVFGRGHDKSNVLLLAIETRDTEVVQLLIRRGADLNKPAGHGTNCTALQRAAELNSIEIVRLLLDNNAEVNAPPLKLRGATALQYAAIHGNCDMVMMLIEHGARLDVPPPIGPYGRWPLEGAAENGRFDMIQLLWDINNGPFDIKQCKRAMRLAEYNGHIGCKDLIIELTRDSVMEY